MERIEVYFDAELGQDIVFRNAWIPNFQARRVGDRWFLSNPAGSWMFVDEEQYQSLASVAVPLSLFREAESRHLILTATNGQSYFDAYERWTTPHFRHPVHHIIISTLRCNLSCTYCHAAVVPASASKDYDLTVPVGEAILEFALNSKARVQSFEFQGGESLLNKEMMFSLIPRIRQSYEAAGKSVYLSVQTNATLLTEEWIAFFRANEVKVGTSVDGPEELHDSQRVLNSGRGSYKAVMDKVQKFKLPVLPTITQTSLPYWKEIVDKQLAKGSSSIAFQNVYPINAAKANWEEVGISMGGFLEHYDRVVEYLRSLWTEGYYPLERRFYLALKKLYAGRDVDFADFGNPCGMIHSQIVYHTNGDVYTCDEGRDFPEFRLGNVLTDRYDDVVFGQKGRRLKTLSLPGDPECMTCAYRPVCSTCPVYDLAATGELQSRHAGTDKCQQTMYIFDKLLSWLEEDPQLLDKLADYHGISK